MRCSCRNCGVYMVQSEDSHLGCACPECGGRCTDCLGTNSVLSRESIAELKKDPARAAALLASLKEADGGEEE